MFVVIAVVVVFAVIVAHKKCHFIDETSNDNALTLSNWFCKQCVQSEMWKKSTTAIHQEHQSNERPVHFDKTVSMRLICPLLSLHLISAEAWQCFHSCCLDLQQWQQQQSHFHHCSCQLFSEQPHLSNHFVVAAIVLRIRNDVIVLSSNKMKNSPVSLHSLWLPLSLLLFFASVATAFQTVSAGSFFILIVQLFPCHVHLCCSVSFSFQGNSHSHEFEDL